MNRRAFAGALATALSAGCLDGAAPSATDGSDGTGTDGEATGPDEAADESQSDTVASETDGIVISGVYPRETERTFFDYEYVELENAGSDPVDVSGYTVEYDGGHTHVLDDLTLEPGATLVLSSRSGDGVVLDRSPPIYYRFTGFGPGVETSVLGESGTVVVRDADEDPVADRRYDGGGDDGECDE